MAACSAWWVPTSNATQVQLCRMHACNVYTSGGHSLLHATFAPDPSITTKRVTHTLTEMSATCFRVASTVLPVLMTARPSLVRRSSLSLQRSMCGQRGQSSVRGRMHRRAATILMRATWQAVQASRQVSMHGKCWATLIC